MFSSTQDVLYIVISLCAIWLTVFLCWLLFQAARVLKNANDIIENVSNKLELIAEAVEFIRKKVDVVSSGMGSMVGLVGHLVEKFVVNKLNEKMQSHSKAKKRRGKTFTDEE